MTVDKEPDAIWSRAEIASPCIRVCVLHPTAKLCLGCYRSAAEIAGWSAMSHEERLSIMGSLAERETIVALAGPSMRPGRRRNKRFSGRSET